MLYDKMMTFDCSLSGADKEHSSSQARVPRTRGWRVFLVSTRQETVKGIYETVACFLFDHLKLKLKGFYDKHACSNVIMRVVMSSCPKAHHQGVFLEKYLPDLAGGCKRVPADRGAVGVGTRGSPLYCSRDLSCTLGSSCTSQSQVSAACAPSRRARARHAEEDVPRGNGGSVASLAICCDGGAVADFWGGRVRLPQYDRRCPVSYVCDPGSPRKLRPPSLLSLTLRAGFRAHTRYWSAQSASLLPSLFLCSRF